MTDFALDQSPASDASGTPTPTPAPAPTPPSAVAPSAEPDQGDEGLDLLSVDDEDADGETEGDDAPETSVRPIGPGEDATDEQIAEWRREHGVPDDAAGYEAPVVEGIEWNADALSPIHEIAHRHNVPQQAVTDALAEYAKQIQAQQAALKVRDAENAKAVRSALSADEVASVKAAARSMPAELRTLLNQARGPDGSRIINNPEVLMMIISTYAPKAGARTRMQDTTDRAGLQAELAEIDSAMFRDAAELSRPWKATGVSAAQRKQQIMDEVGNRPPAANVREEESALLALHARDPDVFQYRPDWRGTKKTGAQRLYELRSGRG